MSPFSSSSPVEPSLSPDDNSADSSAKSARQGAGCVVVFCGLFTLIGAWMLFTLFLRPVTRVMAARSWVAVPCRITSSVLTPHSDSDGTSYSADIIYFYNYAGQSYSSGRYSFSGQRSGGYKSRQNVVTTYPTGSSATCYVDPNSPGEAVLNRDFSSEVWMGLLSLPFLGFGLGGIAFAIRTGKAANHPQAQWRLSNTPGENQSSFELRPKSSPLARFIGLGLVSAFWNGIVGVIVYQTVFHAGSVTFSAFAGLFFIPFLLIGGLIFYGWLLTGLSLANARPRVTLSGGPLRPGQSANLHFELRGGLFFPQSIELSLEGREEATFTRGTDTITDKSSFYFQILPTIGTTRSGDCAFSIPASAMHSLEAPHNKIVWLLRLRGPIARWPDIEEEWKVSVEPAV